MVDSFELVQRLAEMALAIKVAGIDPLTAFVRTTVAESIEAYGNEAKKSIIKESARLGKKTGPALTRLLKRLAKLTAIGAGGLLLPRLVTTYPTAFGWLEPVLKFLNLL